MTVTESEGFKAADCSIAYLEEREDTCKVNDRSYATSVRKRAVTARLKRIEEDERRKEGLVGR